MWSDVWLRAADSSGGKTNVRVGSALDLNTSPVQYNYQYNACDKVCTIESPIQYNTLDFDTSPCITMRIHTTQSLTQNNTLDLNT